MLIWLANRLLSSSVLIVEIITILKYLFNLKIQLIKRKGMFPRKPILSISFSRCTNGHDLKEKNAALFASI
jgi:hypothetical protein